MTDWSVQQARDIYHITQWSDGFFDIGEQGTIRVYPHGSREHASIDLFELSQHLYNQGIPLPVLVRFTDILKKRIQILNDAFTQAIQENQYKGHISALILLKLINNAALLKPFCKMAKYLNLILILLNSLSKCIIQYLNAF